GGMFAVLFFEQVLAEARERGLTSDEHLTVDGTLVEAWAGLKSFKRKDGSDRRTPPDDPGNPTVNFHGEKRSNETHLGLPRAGWTFTFALAAYNLVRIRNLVAVPL